VACNWCRLNCYRRSSSYRHFRLCRGLQFSSDLTVKAIGAFNTLVMFQASYRLTKLKSFLRIRFCRIVTLICVCGFIQLGCCNSHVLRPIDQWFPSGYYLACQDELLSFTFEVFDHALSIVHLFAKLLILRPGVTRRGFLIIHRCFSAPFKCSSQVFLLLASCTSLKYWACSSLNFDRFG